MANGKLFLIIINEKGKFQLSFRNLDFAFLKTMINVINAVIE